MRNALALLAVLWLFPVEFAHATPQAGSTSGEIRGRVTDPQRVAIPSVSIRLLSQSTNQQTTLTTDESGAYRALLLKPDAYEVRAEFPGFDSITRRIALTVGQIAVIDFDLQLKVSTTSIDVISPLAEPDRTQQSNTVAGSQLQGLPIDKRNYLTYSLLMPGVVDADALADANDYRPPQTAHSGLSFHGNNGRGNSVVIDGGEANDSGGGVRPTLSQEAVREFQVNRSNYSAEMGGASGGTINIISRSGTNARHGSAYVFLRDQALDAGDPFALGPDSFANLVRIKPKANRQQFGATFGGPITPNRTFFFLAFEGLDRFESNVVSVANDQSIFQPTTEQEAILATLPAPTAAALRSTLTIGSHTKRFFQVNSGAFPFEGTDYKASLRLDHQYTPQDQFMFRYNVADIGESNPNTRALIAASRAVETDRLDHTGMLTWTRTLSSKAVSQLHYQFNYGTYRVDSRDKLGPELNVNGFGYFKRDSLLPSNLLWRRHEFSEKLSLSMGRHLLKIGGEARLRQNVAEAHLFLGGRFDFGPLPGSLIHPALSSTTITALQAADKRLPSTYQQGFGDPTVRSTEPFLGIYAADRWQIARNLTLDFGLRYEVDDLRDPVRTDRNNLAPRLAFAWDVSGDHHTTVRGGFGIFYAPTNYALIHVANALGEVGGQRQIAQVLTTISTPGAQSSVNLFRSLFDVTFSFLSVNGTITEADLARFGINVSHTNPSYPAVLFRSSPDFASAYTQQASLGVERELGSALMVSANYLFTSGLRIMRARDQNLLPVPVNPALGVRVWSLTTRDPNLFSNPGLLQDNVYESTGRSFYHSMTLEAQKRFSRRFSLNANYTLSKAIDDVVDFNSDFQATDQLDLRAERALSSFDQRHKVVTYASIEGPGGVTIAPVFRANSGRPFNLLVGSDLNQDLHSTTDRPPFAGRNTGKGPNFWTMDLRISRQIQADDNTRIELIGEAFNLFNRLNFRSVNNTVGNMTPPFDVKGRKDLLPSQPLAFTSAFDPRRIQLGVRLTF